MPKIGIIDFSNDEKYDEKYDIYDKNMKNKLCMNKFINCGK
jgi:hypothetical protein